MSISAEKLEEMLSLLVKECTDGYLHFRIWRRINNAFIEMPKKLEQFKVFLIQTWLAHDQAALNHLIRILDRDSKSVSVHRLLNVAHGNTQLFQYVPRDQLLKVITEHKAKLNDELRDLIDNIKIHRVTYAMHLDEKLLSLPLAEILDNHPITRTNIEKLYCEAIAIIDSYYQFYFNKE
jgi:hypothetical protein